MSRQNEYQGFFGAEPTQNRPLIIDVPPAPPKLHRRYRTGLERPYRGVGVEFEHYEYEESGLGTVWQSWFMLGMAIAFIAPAGIGMLVMGEWVIVLVLSPLVGLFLVGMVRSLLAEQKAKRAKQARRLRSRRS
ncbi:MAG: hypothetical protein AAGN15_02300 [Cyanobacteria bacterium J06581_3]